jgi:hypothetical protein
MKHFTARIQFYYSESGQFLTFACKKTPIKVSVIKLRKISRKLHECFALQFKDGFMIFKLLQFLMFAVEVWFLLLSGNIEPFIVFLCETLAGKKFQRKIPFCNRKCGLYFAPENHLNSNQNLKKYWFLIPGLMQQN